MRYGRKAVSVKTKADEDQIKKQVLAVRAWPWPGAARGVGPYTRQHKALAPGRRRYAATGYCW